MNWSGHGLDPDAPTEAVRVVNEDGYTEYNRLLDMGSDCMPFDSPGGMVFKSLLEPGQRIVRGWLSQEEFERERAIRWPHLR